MTHPRVPALLATLASLVCVATAAPAAPVASVFGGKIACSEQSGVQFCPGDVSTRIESWDGVPLDVNVTLPPASMADAAPTGMQTLVSHAVYRPRTDNAGRRRSQDHRSLGLSLRGRSGRGPA